MIVRHPNWAFAEELLGQVASGSRGFDVDKIGGLTIDSWAPFPIDDRDPAIVSEELVEYCAPRLAGMLVVVTFLSFRADVGPFFVDARHLGEFSTTYPDAYDDALVAGDTFVLSPTSGRLVVVHHDGLIATVQGRPSDALGHAPGQPV